MKWKKLGLVYTPDGSMIWAQSHAMIPTPIRLNEEVIRVFCTSCADDGLGRPGYVDVSAQNPSQLLAVSREPLLKLGSPGTFDENGIIACSVIQLERDKLLMHYVGFELGTRIRYRLLTGAAISEDKGHTFKRYAATPVLERSAAELYFRCGAYCVKEDGIFRLWYVAGSNWIDIDDKPMPVYDVRYLESNDGLSWPDEGEVQIAISDPDEHGFGRPCVIPRAGGGYRMFYSVRRSSLKAYRLGYAESEDGRNWQRMDDKLNLDISPNSFDSHAIMYAAPIDIDGKLYVFYNGNEFGLEGFAAAVLEAE